MKTIAILLVLASSLSGCVVTVKVTKTKDSTMLEYSAPAFGTKHLKRFQLDKDIYLDGYGSVQSDVATTIAAAIAAGIEAGKVLAKPTP